MLGLLPSLGDMLSGHQESYSCLLWQCLHSPLAAFGALWGDIVVKGKTHPRQSEASLKAAKNLPAFFSRLSARNPLAAKLESITGRMVQSARSLLYSQGKSPSTKNLNGETRRRLTFVSMRKTT